MLTLFAHSSAWFFFASHLRNDPALERKLCHFGICQSEVLTERGYRELWRDQHPQQAIFDFREGLIREATNPLKWCDLGDALAQVRQMGDARRYYEQAEILGPNTPPVLLRMAAFYVFADERAKGLRCVSRILQMLSAYHGSFPLSDSQPNPITTPVFSIYGRPVDDFLKYGLPAQREPAQAYLHFLIRLGDIGGAQKAWSWILSHSLADLTLANEYSGFLVKNHMYEAAASAWSLATVKLAGDYWKSNLIFNGDFEFEPVGTTFDWRLSPVKNVDTALDSTVAYSGSRSLRIQFNNAENRLYANVMQNICIGPGSYRFQAKVKSEQISGEQGFIFHLFDQEAPSRLNVGTDRITGTTIGWKTIDKTFRVPSETRFLLLWLERQPSRIEGVTMQGTLWVDRVGLFQYGVEEAAFARGTYVNQNHFVGLLEMAFPFVAMYGALLLRRTVRSRDWRMGSMLKAYAVLLLSVMILLGIICSLSRMGLAASVASLLLLVFLVNRGTWSQGRKLAAALTLLVLLPLSMIVLLPARLADPFTVLADRELRPQLWADTLNLIREYPLVGCGLGGFGITFPKYQTVTPGWAYPHAHNDYLQLVAELGSFGVIFPAMFMLTIYVQAWRTTSRRFGRRVRYLAIASTGALTAIRLHSLTDFNLYIPANALALTWISGIVSILGHCNNKECVKKSGVMRPEPGITDTSGGRLLPAHR